MNQKIRNELVDIADRIQGIACEERDKFDNLPEELQESDKGLAFADKLDEIYELIYELLLELSS